MLNRQRVMEKHSMASGKGMTWIMEQLGEEKKFEVSLQGLNVFVTKRDEFVFYDNYQVLAVLPLEKLLYLIKLVESYE